MQSTKHSLLFYVIIPYDQAPLICISLILKTHPFPMYVPARGKPQTYTARFWRMVFSWCFNSFEDTCK